MPIPSAIVTLVLGMILVLSGLWVGQNVNLLPAAASTNAPLYDELFAVLFTIGTILFLGIVGLLIFSLVRFRRRDGDLGDGVAVEGNLQLEIFWTAIPAIVVLFVGIYSYDIYDRMGGMIPLADPHAMHASMGSAVMPASVEELVTQDVEPRLWGGIGSPGGTEAGLLPVEVTALQFAFLFHYPEGDFTSGELHVKAGQTVELRMEARDVIHAFWVPQFRLKQDVIPGQPTVLTFTPTLPGQYPIICAELCGPYHGGMRSTVVVHEPEAFDSWLASNRPATLALTAQLATG
ncbi:cytochrome c oxidase subunit II [Synechococcus sp. CS-1324]|uniref:cytochrome c oxidase subunit II n=1 Tax=Synechococcus sp. CS-1324 TaxID=2847980 RepID=UPI000DB3A322|nr:cytochrome c oxidase subunit II [Synechococcus sp. CS-1324]MCT0231446.1 cytochrome c oxidase subunit II [Synechococcus sp. CS-1324]PZV01539.1 MAG: cytochrome C oxidase subunit II [Cyanobium sp.]